MPSTSNRQASIDSRRIALEREITIRVPRFDTFVTEYSSNISTTGMFIVSDKPQAPGTTFGFEFSVADDWKLIRGKAQVVWARYRDEGGERPAGMGVRFVELDAQSRRLIRWIVEKHIREGGKPFELDELRNVIDEALEEVVDTDEVPPSAQTHGPSKIVTAGSTRPVAQRPVASRQTSERNIVPLVATAGAIVVGLVFLFWLTEWLPSRDEGEQTVAAGDATGVSQAASTGVDGNGDGAATAGGDASSEGEPDGGAVQGSGTGGNGAPISTPGDPAADSASDDSGGPPVGSAYAGIRQALSDWSSAWSNQDVDGYLAAYSREFEPPGTTRAAWQTLRRDRITEPRFIRVSIARLDIQRVQDNLVTASFSQSYRSDRFSDTVGKELQMVWEDGGWKIWREAAR
ncbi:MAG: TIGR02266 family protein [Thermoanaerobaculia bacterium]